MADVNKFMLALLNNGEYKSNQILSRATTQLMLTQQFSPAKDMPSITYGLFEHFENGQYILLRDGDGVGTRTRMVLLPEHNLGFVISYNSGATELRLEFVSDFLDEYYPEPGDGLPAHLEGFEDRASRYAGAYRPLQADANSFGKSMYFFSQIVEITVTDEGYLSIATTGMGGEQSSVMGGFEGTTLWVEVEPLYFERIDGRGQLAFLQDEEGNITQMISGQGYHSPFEKLPWYESASFQIILIELVVLLIVSMVITTFISWPLSALISRWRKKPVEKSKSWVAVVARIWAAMVGLLLALFVFRAIGVLYAIDAVGGMPNFVWGVTEEMKTVLNDIYLPVFLAIPLPIFTGLAWGFRWWKTNTRVHYTLDTLAIIGGIWWANYWNLLGFRM